MFKKFVLVALLLSPLLVSAFVALSSVPVVASPLIICVPNDYQTIQEALDAANSEDTILVSAGTYYEHVRVNKTVSLVGESRETTIIDGNGTGAVYVTANNVKIIGFTIQNGGGVFLNHTNGNIIYENTIASNDYSGVWLEESSGNLISGNKILNNGGGPPGLRYGEGITLIYSNANIISNNSISNNVVLGIDLCSSHDNIVNHNTFSNNLAGVFLSSSAGNIVNDNVITLNGNGISLESSTGNTVEHNQIFKNEIGIGIGHSIKNVVKENKISENTVHGVVISHMSSNITVVGNTISNNYNGIRVYSSGSIIYHNNFINNTINALKGVDPNTNTWDGGYPFGGNYWSDYSGQDLCSGLYQNVTGSDGIGDTAYTIDVDNKDRFPLMGPISFFDAGTWNGTSRDVHVISNSTISNFQLNKTQRRISFNVTGPNYTLGFFRVTIPNIIVQDLWQNNYTVLVDEKQPLMINNWTDGTYTYIYFTYLHSEHEVVIIQESLVATTILIFMIITLYAVILRKKS